MTPDDEAARKARAQRLRETVREIESGKEPTKPSEPGQSPVATNPREFIHKRMRELDRKPSV
jgi:hypothetical protein